MGRPSINDYAVIGEGRTVALVSRDGAVDWLCWPRADSPSLFARLLDDDGGTFVVRPTDSALRPNRQYLPRTNVLVTQWKGPQSELQVLDWMPVSAAGHHAASCEPDSALVRVATCMRGRVAVRVEFSPRPDYGRSRRVAVYRRRLGAIMVDVGRGCAALTCTRPLRTEEGSTLLWLNEGESVSFALTYSAEAPEVIVDASDFAQETLEPTIRAWRYFADRVTYDGPHAQLVVRAALALKLLIHAPSGALLAAATTSLPERFGGDLNWDYRYCWPRDAALTVRALSSLGFDEEADAYASWLLHATRLTRPRMSVLYDVFGRTPPREQELEHWSGFRGARPVRIHNGAADQLQLDTYGEVIDAVAHQVRGGARLDGETSRMLVDFGDYVCRNWERPDAGIWEVRGKPQHFTHSKVLCWVALERILEIDARQPLRRVPRDRFLHNRELLRSAIERDGWSQTQRSYVQTFGGERLDASLLLMSWYGFEDASTPRMRCTARALQKRLSPAPGLLYRYDQSLEVGEGAFAICGFWLAEFLARGGGTLEEAERWFDAAAAYANDVGLLSEEIHPRTGELMGNFPQAFSHVGLISAACALEERRRSSHPLRTRPLNDEHEVPT